MLTRTIFVGSSVLSVGMVGYLSSITKLHAAVHLPATATTTAPTTTAPTPAGTSGSSASTPVTTTVPVTTTTTCYTTPSGNTTCN